MATLRIRNGPLAGQTFEVVGELVIGREHAGVTIEDARASRRHALVRMAADGLKVEDLGSTNGTFVDGERLEGTKTVGDGTEIRVGSTVIEVLDVAPAEATRPQRATDAAATRLGSRPQSPEVTRERPRVPVDEGLRDEARPPAPVTPPPPSPPPPAPPAAPEFAPAPGGAPPAPAVSAPPAGAVPAPPLADFSPPPMRRGTGLASRSWVPVALSFGSVILTAIALIVYFAAR